MARAYASASSQYHEIASAVVAVQPLTMACWAFMVNATAIHTLMQIGDASGTHAWKLFARGDVAGDPIQASATAATATGAASTSTTYSANTWHHCAARFNSNTSRDVFLDGGGNVNNTTNTGTPAGLDVTNLGCRYIAGVPATFLGGRLAEAAIWNVALTDAEIASLAVGLCPLFVRPAAIVGYWPLFARATDEEAWAGIGPMVTSGATAAAHPRIVYPGRRRLILPAAAAPGGVTFRRSLQVRIGSRQAA